MEREEKNNLEVSDILRIAVTFKRPSDRLGLTRYGARMSSETVHSFKPDPVNMEQAAAVLLEHGFAVSSRGELTLSVRGKREDFERLFGTKLVERRYEAAKGNVQIRSFFAPPDKAEWNPNPLVTELIDDAYIQWPHIYMNQRFSKGEPSPLPPRVMYHHLRAPGDVALLLNAARAHRLGLTGKGVRVAMIDSGFAHGHAYFQEMGYLSSAVLAPGASGVNRDGNGHGTGESANIFAVAPDVTFIGIKLDNEEDPSSGATILEGLQEAMRHNPQVISISMGYDLVHAENDRRPQTRLPNSLKALEAEIQAAVAAKVTVVFSSGNGHVAFPGMMPEVISTGGVFVDEKGGMQASDYSSAFSSAVYPGRRVPDFCGLVGMQPGANYIMLPIEAGCEVDRSESESGDKTKPKDGWGVFSGTSAAAPQIAGVCALLLQKNPGLTPEDIKAVLRRTSRDVTFGAANPQSNEGIGVAAGPGSDGATGAGLVDAYAACRQV